MARPQKVGLDYFPLDVDLFNDPKAERITAQFGLIGDAILVRLLCRIYREGYCTAFGACGLRFFRSFTSPAGSYVPI